MFTEQLPGESEPPEMIDLQVGEYGGEELAGLAQLLVPGQKGLDEVLGQAGVLSLLAQQLHQLQLQLHHNLLEMSLQSLEQLVRILPDQLVNSLLHGVQGGLRSVGVVPGLVHHQPVHNLEVVPELQPALLELLGLLRHLCHQDGPLHAGLTLAGP